MPTATRLDAPQAWPAAGRLGFRFLSAYLVLLTVPGPFGYLPFAFTRWLSQWQFDASLALSRWTQIHLFGIASPAPFAFTGSADTLYRYATYLNYLLIAVLVGL